MSDEITMDDHWKEIGANQRTIYQNKIHDNVLLLKKKRSLLIVSSLIPLNPLESEIIFKRIINLTISE